MGTYVRNPVTEKDYELIEQKQNEKPNSRLGFARMLNELDPSRSVKGWEMAIMRWEKGEHKSIRKQLEETLDSPDGFKVGGKYYYDEKNDTYIVYLNSARQSVYMDGKKHREMLNDYSEMTGKGLDTGTMAIKYGMPKNWFMEYKRIFGWLKSGDCFSDEEILSENEQDLTNRLLLQKRKSVTNKFNALEQKGIATDAEKWRTVEEVLFNEFKEIMSKDISHYPPMLELEESAIPYTMVMSPTDFHWGKYGWEDEVGETYDFDEAKKRLMEKTEEVISMLSSKPEKIILATGSDWFHIDNDLGTTTHGTPQDRFGSPAEILMTGCKLAREHIDLLSQVAPIEVVFMPGNHDRFAAFALMMYLSAAYEENEHIDVIVCPKVRQYIQYGNTLLGFTHGDTAKGHQLPSLMSNEAKKMWGETSHHVWFHGHLHHQKLTEKGGATVVQLPSLAGHDRWHYRKGFTMSKAGLAAYIICSERGLIGSYFAPVNHGDE